VGNTFVQVITDVIVDMDAAAVKVFLPAGSEYFVSFSGIRA